MINPDVSYLVGFITGLFVGLLIMIIERSGKC